MKRAINRIRPTLTLAALAAATLLTQGCYQRVVGARGLGSDRIETQEPYQQDTDVDRWFYGDTKK